MKSNKSSNNKPPSEDDILKLDELHLEKDWARQPLLVRRWTKKQAMADKVVDDAKANLKLVEAQLEKDIRENPSDYELPKVTDKSVEKYVILQDAYQEAITQLNEAKYQAAMIESMVLSLQDRRAALEGMVKLYGLQYWDTPNASPDMRKAMEFAETSEVYGRGRIKKRKKETDD